MLPVLEQILGKPVLDHILCAFTMSLLYYCTSVCLCVNIAPKSAEVETASNSTIDPETEAMTDSSRTAKVYQHLLADRPMSVCTKAPTLDDVRAIIAADFSNADELWKWTAPKKVVSR